MSEDSDIILWEEFFCKLWSERFNTFSAGFYTVIKSSYVLGILVFVLDVSEDLQVKLFARQQLTIFGNKISSSYYSYLGIWNQTSSSTSTISDKNTTS